jgi:hypothetical protein
MIVMAEYYTVVQGDHLSKIAKEYGFPDYHTIWNHPNNAGLKAERKNPNVLFPGDQVFVPDKETKYESGATEKLHTFATKKGTLKLRLVLEDIYETPVAKAPLELRIQSDRILHAKAAQPATDNNGLFEQEISRDAHDGTLTIRSEETAFHDIPLRFRIGDLDPAKELSGQCARLNNLGYFAGDGNDADRFRSAVEEFQCDHHLTVDGKCGPITQAKLEKVHGC